jgi:hypothetical protein
MSLLVGDLELVGMAPAQGHVPALLSAEMKGPGTPLSGMHPTSIPKGLHLPALTFIPSQVAGFESRETK